jgi:hypothetical protein
MRTFKRPAAIVLLAVLTLGACSGEDDEVSTEESTTTTTRETSDDAEVGGEDPIDAVQILEPVDDQMRAQLNTARPCITGTTSACSVSARSAFDNAISMLDNLRAFSAGLLDPESEYYRGAVREKQVVVLDEIVQLATDLQPMLTTFRDDCLPDLPPECEERGDEVQSAIDDLVKTLNHLRDF